MKPLSRTSPRHPRLPNNVCGGEETQAAWVCSLLFTQHLLSTCCLPGTVVDPGLRGVSGGECVRGGQRRMSLENAASSLLSRFKVKEGSQLEDTGPRGRPGPG